MKYLLLLAAFLTLVLPSAGKEFLIAPGHSIVLAEPNEAAAFLAKSDRFTAAMAPLELCIRLKSAAPHTEAGYLRFAASTVLPWSDQDIVDVNAAIHKIQPKLAPIAAILPARTLLIKSTCQDEAGAAYTRGNAIIFPADSINGPRPDRFIAHELFHVITRTNPGLREQLYGVIGFHPCDNIVLPERLASIRLTNPDAYLNDYYIDANSDGRRRPVVPIIFSNVSECDPSSRETLLDSLTLAFMVIEKKGDNWQPLLEGDKPVLIGAERIDDLFDQVGRNTEYIIHPEEICADNFSYSIAGKMWMQSPRIPKRIYEILQKAAQNR